MRIAAVDQGTTSTRLLLAVDGETPQVLHSLRHRQLHPRPGCVEHDPQELLANVRACLDVAGAVDAIALANQGESCLAWDGDSKEPLSPVIVWQDSRTSTMIEQLRAQGAESLTLERAGVGLDPYFAASKLRWMLDQVPAVRDRRSSRRLRLGTTDAFFLDSLTGVFATDATTASRTSLMNLKTGEWDPDLCALFDIPIDLLPAIRDTVSDFGEARWGPVAASVVDQQASLYGHGCRNAGDSKITFGTGAFALAVVGAEPAAARDAGLLSTIAWQLAGRRTYALDGGVYDAGSALEWIGRLGLCSEFSDLVGFADPHAIARGLAFVPALSGLACPHWDRSAAGLWIGMHGGTTRQELCQAVLEGIVLSTADVIDAMNRFVCRTEQLSIDGGLARSPYFCQFLADALQRRILTSSFDELTAFGCASLAAEARGTRLALPGGAARTFDPAVSEATARAWRETFHRAVERSLSWRR